MEVAALTRAEGGAAALTRAGGGAAALTWAGGGVAGAVGDDETQKRLVGSQHQAWPAGSSQNMRCKAGGPGKMRDGVEPLISGTWGALQRRGAPAPQLQVSS